MSAQSSVGTDRPVPEGEILLCLREQWGLTASSVAPLPRDGYGKDNWTFKANSSTGSFFVKLLVTVHEPGIAVSRMLADNGVRVAAPVPSKHGRSWEQLGGFVLLVYPFVTGSPIDTSELGEIDWRALGSTLKEVHDSNVSETLRKSLASETFLPWGHDFLARLDFTMSKRDSQRDLAQQAFVELWSSQGTLAREFFQYVRIKGQIAQRSKPRYCLCHNDFQAGNILRSSPGVLTLIDWDNPSWGPPETDLMFIAPEHRTLFAGGYGPITLNESVLEYASSNWILSEAFDCADRILYNPGTGPAEKQWALEFASSLLKQMGSLL